MYNWHIHTLGPNIHMMITGCRGWRNTWWINNTATMILKLFNHLYELLLRVSLHRDETSPHLLRSSCAASHPCMCHFASQIVFVYFNIFQIFKSTQISVQILNLWQILTLAIVFMIIIMIWYWAKTAELIGGPGAYKYKYNIDNNCVINYTIVKRLFVNFSVDNFSLIDIGRSFQSLKLFGKKTFLIQ